ncbi:hypothetical protein SAY86_022084 [Trapa natans]|uniref:CCR4-NOT transcription complex subunit 1 n=1 Tax=Trapa natans TaxID=22666 RepID=A0AAN7MB06_TRANT|nr:hypothetical protein SAY86_022084 [Trapa natans]
MLKFSDSVSDHIRFRLQTVEESTADNILRELLQFSEYGVEANILLLQSCLDYMNAHMEDLSMHLEAVLVEIFKHLLDMPNFSTIFCLSVNNGIINETYLEKLSGGLRLSLSEKIGIGLALSVSDNLDTRKYGKNFCMAQIEELSASVVALKSIEQIQNVLMFLHTSEGLCKLVDSFMQMLSLVHPKDYPLFMIAPFLSDELLENDTFGNLDMLFVGECEDFDAILAEMKEQTSMGDIIKEIGYGCTVNDLQCKEILSWFSPLNEITISRLLGTIARTQVGLQENHHASSTYCMAFGGSALSDIPSPSSWDDQVLVDSIQQLAPGINWISVAENLDHEGFYLPDESALSLLMSVYHRASQDPFPLHAICGSIWKNSEGQLSFLKFAVSAPPEIFTFAHSSRQLAYADAVHGHKLQLDHANHAWLCLDLLDVLSQLAERGHANSVRTILEYPLKYCPEVLLLGIAHVNTSYNLLQFEVSLTVFPSILKNADGLEMILYLWHVNPTLVLKGYADAVSLDPDFITRILDICQDLKILSPVLEMIPSSIGIRLAALASRNERIDLETWLNTNFLVYKHSFFEECLEFLKQIEFGDREPSVRGFDHSVGILNAYLEAAPVFIKVLKAQAGISSSHQHMEELERLRVTLTHSNMGLQNGGTTDSSTSEEYPKDVEFEANSYFQKMFSGQLTVDSMVQTLARFKESSVKREKSICDCMIGNLFEEYRFFPKYPERQLQIAAVLFGSVIKHQLVTHIMLGIALRCVLDALRKPADSKMFMFGTKALEQFVDRLIEWPQYCNHILQISHLRGAHPDVVLFIERTLGKISSSHLISDAGNSVTSHIPTQTGIGNSELNSGTSALAMQLSSSLQLQPGHESTLEERQRHPIAPSNDLKPIVPALSKQSFTVGESSSNQKNAVSTTTSVTSSPGFVRPSRGATSARFGSALNIETLVAAAEKRDAPIETPVSEVQDKTSFIINNISAANIETKAKEFTEILKEHYYPWFAQYMVMKRASIEPNFHDLYLKFFDKINSKVLNKEVIQATYENCKVLLGSERIKSSSEERSLLKNLGSWLGKLTIGRNQVLRAREIDPKSLIIEAYEKGKMIAVIPFTSKILEPCQSSLAYQPPNPWTMGILGLLAEIYVVPHLKMNLKFDIEVLFKNLGVDMKDISPTSLLKDRVREVEGNPDFSNKDVGTSQTQMVSDMKSGIMPAINQVDIPHKVANASDSVGHAHLLSQYANPLHLSSNTLIEDEKLAALGLSDQLPPSGQGLLQAAQSQASFSSQLPAPVLNTHVVINQKLNTLGLQLHFQRVVPVAMDRAIKEIVTSIVQRSVTIATQTTKELVLKDYALESDETRIHNAAHLMVASLAGSLAHVTCKEPLRASISSQLRSSLQGLTLAGELLEQAVQLVTNDNLDLGCAVIEQAATDKAIQTIDGEIGQQLLLRRKQREGVAQVFYDASAFAQGSIGVLPEALRPKPGHLSLSQQRVYEDFVRLPWQNHSTQSSHSLPSGHSASASSVPSSSYDLPYGQLSSYVSTQGSSGIEAVARRQQDVPTEGIDTASTPYSSASATHIGATDGVIRHTIEKSSAIPSMSLSASIPELNYVETAGATKEFNPLQALPLPPATDCIGNSISEPSLQPRDALDKYQIVAQKLDDLVTSDARDAEVQRIIAEVPEIVLRCRSKDEAALAVAQKVFKRLYENAANSFLVGAHLAILAAIRDVCKLVVKELTSWVIYSDEERKFNKDITVGLIHSELLNLAEYNLHMAKLIDGGRNKTATEFAISLLHTLVLEECSVVSELQSLVEALAKLATKPGVPESLQQLVDILRNPGASTAVHGGVSTGKEDRGTQSKDKKAPSPIATCREEYNNAEVVEPDPSGFRDQVSSLLVEWFGICEIPGANDAAASHFILKLHQSGFLKGDDMTDRFICCLMEFAVAHCLSSEGVNVGSLQSPQQPQNLSFLAIDTYSKLLFSILKYGPVDHVSSKLFILSRLMEVTVKYIQKDAEEKKTSFNPRPYFRLFINWLLDLNSLDPTVDGASLQILMEFSNAFHALQPLKVPSFSFAWLELVSHRSFMPKILTGNSQKGWLYFQRLLVDLFQFMEPFLRNAELGGPVHFLYKGTLRVLLVLLHDFPEFLCDYHFTFCDVIPTSCIQMRNIILSAFPHSMRLPDPSTPNLKIDLLAEIREPPHILSEVDAALKAKQMKAEIDEYLKTRPQGSSFLTELKQRLLLPPAEAAISGTRYDVPLINSLVLYVGMQAIQQLQARTAHTQTPVNPTSLAVFLMSAALDIFQILIVELDTEGRYLFLNAVANQLRYPNTHTHYFSFIVLYLYAESSQEIIQEQITRVLFERLFVNRPHPWGLLITFIELIKNPRYNFWNRAFIRCAPEIEKLFEPVARSCGGPKPVDESPVSAWISENSR